MSVLDHGGADMAFEVPKAELLIPLARDYVFPGGVPTPVTTSFLRGWLDIRARITDIELAAPDRIAFQYALATSTLRVTDIFRRGRWVPVQGATTLIPIGGSARGDHRVEASGTSIQVRTAGNAPSVAAAITAALDPAAFLRAPLIEAIVWEYALLNPTDPLAVERRRQELACEIEDALPAGLAGFLGVFIPPLLVNAPGLTIATPVVGADFAIRGDRLHALFAIGGSTGTPASIGRSSLRPGPPPDRAAFVLSNAALLRDIVRPILVGALGMGTTGFLAGHPCWSVGPVAFGFVPARRPLVTFIGSFVDSLVAGITEAGGLRVLMELRIVFNLFSIVLNIDLPIAMTLTRTTTTGAAFLLLTPGAPIVATRIDMPAWVYGLSALSGGSIGLAATAIVDAIVDTTPAGVRGLRFVPPTRSISIGMPMPLLPLAGTSVAFTQADAPPRTVTIGGATRIDPFRVHDLIVTLA